MGNPNAEGRNTDIASLLEYFLDEHRDELSPDMFKQLDSLAGDIDKKVEELEESVTDLESEVEELQNKVNDLEGN